MLAETKRRRENYLEAVPESSNTEEEERNWKILWKVAVPSKLRLFAWRLARSSLPTGEGELIGIWQTFQGAPYAMLLMIHGDTLFLSVIWLIVCGF
jgi:hypothetical protein